MDLADPCTPAFLDALSALPPGYGEGSYAGSRWGVTLTVAPDTRRLWLYGEALGGGAHVSFNLFNTAAGPRLRPCEMPADTVVAFVLGYRPDR